MPHRRLHVTECGVQRWFVVLVAQLSDEIFGQRIVVAVVIARCFVHGAVEPLRDPIGSGMPSVGLDYSRAIPIDVF